jgi:4-amino-4-deoxy-L-arabinose transferase-like glycosyltransferase
MSSESSSPSNPAKPAPPTESAWSVPTVVHRILFVGLIALFGVSLAHREYAERMFIHATYYFLLVLVVAWIGTYLHVARDVRTPAIALWIKDNKAGIIVALLVTVVSALAIHPALRVLSDETNLLGTSKNLFYSKTATFTTTGKYYYDNFWDAGVVIDRRPSLFPFLVSLVHVLRGYSYTNVFLFNLLVMPVFVLVSYRLAKSASNETVGIVAALLVAAHPITLISMRSGGFDFLAAFFSVLVIKSFLDHSRAPSAGTLAVLWMNLCMFAEIRYETGLFLPPVVVVLLLFGLIKRSYLRPYRLLYALTPAFFLPRIWQAFLRGNVPEQDAGAINFSFNHFIENARDYFKPILSPFEFHPPHSAIVIGVGVVGSLLWLRWLDGRIRSRDWKTPKFQFATMVAVWMVVQLVIVFSYVWGRAQHPAASRLVIAIDTFFSFPAAWLLTVALQRFRPFVVTIIAAALFAVYVPVASEYRILNELTLTREAATTWRFFESLHENRIMVVTDRPGLYTVMNYGATDFESAKADASLLPSLDRHLFFDMYLVQQIDLTTNHPIAQHEIWAERARTPMVEFQNDANSTVRISRLAH